MSAGKVYAVADDREIVVGGTTYVLKLTSVACPEQYDVTSNGDMSGYLRLRHGGFAAHYPDYGGRLVYESEPDGDGMFTDEERLRHLTAAVESLHSTRIGQTSHE